MTQKDILFVIKAFYKVNAIIRISFDAHEAIKYAQTDEYLDKILEEYNKLNKKITMDNKDFDTLSEDTAQGLLDAFRRMNDALKGSEDIWQRNYGMLVDEIKLKCAEKLMLYVDKYAQATFLTRWYWKRKMEKFIKGIDVLKELCYDYGNN